MIHQQCEMFPAQELGIPLIVHGTNSLDPRYRVVPHNYQLGKARG